MAAKGALSRRRLMASSAASFAWGRIARAQNGLRRIGTFRSEGNTEILIAELGRLGWIEGKNVLIEQREQSNPDVIRASAQELIALKPDVIVAPALSVWTVRDLTKTIPIVFTQIVAPVERGLVASLARPGGNITGFTNADGAIGSKWLGLLKEAAPKLIKTATLFDPDDAPQAPFYQRSIEAASRTLGIDNATVPVRTNAEIEAAVAALPPDGKGALIVPPDNFTALHGKTIIEAATRHRVPAIYPFRFFADEGGLLAYGDDAGDEYRGAADYVSRILNGANPGDLPVQEPTRYQLVINLKTAKAMDLTFPATMLVRADEVIE
jgi:putative ABC transport system substrate-binding protein